MARQNIFDDPVFFEGYRRLRENEVNANTLFEIPALFSLLPDLKEKSVLDLGCGFGEHCVEYLRRGAGRVVGIDISEKMLEVARSVNSAPGIEYINMSIEDLDRITGGFDVVISSLAFHYVEDFSGAVKNIHSLLNRGGILLFSQEHPLVTCYSGAVGRWTRDENGSKLYLNLESYGVEGEKRSAWFVEGIIKYHRMFSTVINTLTEAGFLIEKMLEPLPDEELLKRHPEYCDLYHRPDFLVLRASKR